MLTRLVKTTTTKWSPNVFPTRQQYIRSCNFFCTSSSSEEELKVLPVVVEGHTAQDDIEEDAGHKLKPLEIVRQLDNFIIGQKEAKKAVAIALRNRWRRQKVPKELRSEINPKNILMIGPTGCGKTEIARRLAKLAEAPFVKVEATKFTEVGFHGKDVDQILRDLVENAITLVKKNKTDKMRKAIKIKVENAILDALLGQHSSEQSREDFMEHLRAGNLDDRKIQVDVPINNNPGNLGGIPLSGANMESVNELVKLGAAKVFSTGKKTERKTMTVAEAYPIYEEIEMENAVDMSEVTKEAIRQTEDNGIVFIDEIDKIVSTGDYRGADASDEGVQRDLLPLIEGSTISTKHGNVNTDHILFIASGAFHSSKPSNLLAELQGRLPIRVELKALKESDLYRILTEPIYNLIKQQVELIRTEDVELDFQDDALKEIARVSYEVNKTVENIGARRLHTILEKVVEDISFDASEKEPNSNFVISKEYVTEKVGKLLKKEDLSKFIL